MNWQTAFIGSLIALATVGCESMMQAGASEATTKITVQVDQPGAKINPAMWGAFFEDINFGADGGLYAQMVKNGMFEFPDGMMGWFLVRPSLAKGEATVIDEKPFKETNPHFVRISSKANAPIGVSNEGFRGMGVRAGDAYDFSAQVRRIDGRSRVTIEIVGSDGTTLASAPINNVTNDWSKITATLRPKDTDANARMTIILDEPGTIDFDLVSLFPQKTWKSRPGGLRADMVQALADLKPGFLRFPGGCIVEGSDLSRRYQWKNTIGPIENRKLLINRWNYEFKHRPTPDYFQSFGLGFFEFFQLCEDIGAEPLPIINCGMACQFNSGELCTPEELNNYIQDALDLIEFANGPATSTWGAKRAAMGHPAPFNVKMMGVGNEQWGQQYLDRLAAFTQAIKAAHPEISLVSDAGPSPSDERFAFLWPKLVEMHADIVDQHCYANPIWFLSNSDRYDNYDRKGRKVFFGEYAAQSVAIVSTKNRNNLECAISEAAYMTGLERNADVVRMASYAPLFANIDAWQWTPNLIWTDSLRAMPTPNYYVQQMYMHNRGDVVLPTVNNAPVREILPAGRIGIGSSRANAEFSDVRVEMGSTITTPFDANFTTNDSTRTAGELTWKDYTLTMKARKTGGAGSIIINVCVDDSGSWARWIVGGWNNTQHAILTHYAEQDQLLQRMPGGVENNRWYDLKVVVKGGLMECYLDNKPIVSSQILHHHVPSLFTSATRDEKTGEVILKVANPGDKALTASFDLRGAKVSSPDAQIIELSGNNNAENSLDKPDRITPRKMTMSAVSQYTFQPRSFTVLRFKT